MGIAAFPVIALPLAAEMAVGPCSSAIRQHHLWRAAFGAPILSMAVPRWGACRRCRSGSYCAHSVVCSPTRRRCGALIVCSLLLGFAVTMMTPTSAHLLMRYTPPRTACSVFAEADRRPPGWALMALIAPADRAGVRLALVARRGAPLAVATAAALQRVRPQWDDDRHARASARTRVLEGMRVLWRRPPLRWLVMTAFASPSCSFASAPSSSPCSFRSAATRWSRPASCSPSPSSPA